MEDLTRLLPPDVLAEVLRRLESPRRVATSRCVCKAWRDVVDACGLLRADHLPLSLAGIFTQMHSKDAPKYFSLISSTKIVPFDYLDTHEINCRMIMEQCNGLLLLGYKEIRVLNPATRQWACLPSPPPMCTPGFEDVDESMINYCMNYHEQYLVFDPTVSPDYEVFSIKRVPYDCIHLANWEIHAREWPPSTFVIHVFSSRTKQWEKKPFIREGEAAGTIGHMFAILGAPCPRSEYWRDALYVHQHDFLMRITLENCKYQVIKLPTGLHVRGYYDNHYVGKSKKGIYCTLLYGYDGLHYGYDGYGLRVWFLDESSGHMKWDLKHDVNLKPLLADFPWKYDDRPWNLQHGNVDGDDMGRAPTGEEFDWSFDYYSPDPDDPGYIPHRYAISLLGFHPNKEVIFFHTPSKRVVAYHFDSSRIEDRGFLPTGYIYKSFPYMPCRTGELSDNSLERLS